MKTEINNIANAIDELLNVTEQELYNENADVLLESLEQSRQVLYDKAKFAILKEFNNDYNRTYDYILKDMFYNYDATIELFMNVYNTLQLIDSNSTLRKLIQA